MKVDPSYKYYVIQFRQSPFQNIDDFVCVPTTWIDDRGSKGIFAAYPSERLPTTRSIVKSRQDYDKEWKFYLCTPKYGTNCPWDAENIIRVESSKKLKALLDTQQVLPPKQSRHQENKPKSKAKMNTRDELTQSLKRKVSIDCGRNRKAARIESTPGVPEPISNVSNSEKNSKLCKDLAVMISRLPELLITKSKIVDLTNNEEQNPSKTSYVEKLHSHHPETSISSANKGKKSPEKDHGATSSSSSSLMQILQETPDSVNNRRNSTSSRPSSQSGQLTMNATKSLVSTTSLINKPTNTVSADSNSSTKKIDANRPLQNNNYNNPPAKATRRRNSVRKSTELDTLDNIQIFSNITPEGKRLLQEFIASGGLKGIDHELLQSCLKNIQDSAQAMQIPPAAMQAAQRTPPVMQSAEVAPQVMLAAQRTPPVMQSAEVVMQAAQRTSPIVQSAQVAPYAMHAAQRTPPVMQSAQGGQYAIEAAQRTPAVMQAVQAAQHSKQPAQRTPPVMQSAQVAPHAMKAAQRTPPVMQAPQVAPHPMQAAQRTTPVMQCAQVGPHVMQAAQATLHAKQGPKATPQPMQAAQASLPATQTAQVTLQAMQAAQVALKQAQTINNSPRVPYPITADTPILYQDPHERQITTERSTVTKIIDPTYSQSRAHNVSNIQNISNLQYLSYNNQVIGESQHRQTEQQVAANGKYANQIRSSGCPTRRRVADRSYTTCCPQMPENVVPSNVHMPDLQKQHYAGYTVPLPNTSKTSGPKNQMPCNIQMPPVPQQSFASHPIPPVPIPSKVDQTSKLIHTMPNIPTSNHPHSYEYSYHDRHNYSHEGYNYSLPDTQVQPNLMYRSGTGHKHPSLGVPTQRLHTYPPNAANQLRQLHSAHVNKTVIPQACSNYPHQVPEVQENITASPRSNDMLNQIPHRNDMSHDIPTAVQQISNPTGNSNDKTNSTNILNNSNMEEKIFNTSTNIENVGENALSAVKNPNTNTKKSPCVAVEKRPVCNETKDNAVPEEIERSSSTDIVKINQTHNEAEDILIELTNKINNVLSPTFRTQVEVNLIKHFGKVFQIMSDKFGEILEVLNRDQKVIMKKKEMLDKALTSIASYLELQNENSEIKLAPKHSASQKVKKKKKKKKGKIKDVDDDEDDEDDENDKDDDDSLYDGDRHDNNDGDSSDDDDGNNNKGNIRSNSSNNNKLHGKKSSTPSNDNKRSGDKTTKIKDDKKTVDSDGDKLSIIHSNNLNEEMKRRGKKYSFVLPREYSPTNSRWTLIHQSADQVTIELLPKSRIYVNAIKLANCKRISSSYKEFARMLLTLIFTRSALSVCSWTGARANAFAVDENDVRPGLDEHARQVMLNYVERMGRKKKWGMYDEQSVVNSLRAKIQDIRKLFHKNLMINKKIRIRRQ
ncbi:uncharacterized protein LOC111348735 isoform X2 [Spodoptera litura]|nr:uncharacterized protein LOC111348735 isoform X2 [Spodoptera litura]XP_022815309.1 uncharacterized protein LOC111348735 isoform X2 [Spodoptera litura]